MDFPELRHYWKAVPSELEVLKDTSQASVTTSSEQDSSAVLLTGNRKWFWQSDGDKGCHWIHVQLPPDAELVVAVEIFLGKVCAYYPEPSRHCLT